MTDTPPQATPNGAPDTPRTPDTAAAPPRTVAQLRQQLLQLQQLRDEHLLDEATHATARAPLEAALVALVLAGALTDGPTYSAVHASAPTRPAPRASLRTWATLGAGVVVLAATGYWWQGAPGALGQAPAGFGQADAPGGAASAPHALGQDQINQMTAKLAERLKAQPDDAEGWGMLGRSYMALGRHAEALQAYEQLRKLRPDDATAMADYADALAVKNGRQLDGEPLKLITRALELEPDNLKALTLAGTAAFNRGDDVKAVLHWDHAVRLGPAESGMVQQARDGAAEARARGKLPPAAAAAVAAAPAGAKVGVTIGASAPADGAVITGTASLSPEAQRQVAPDDTVFIFARPTTGSRMPLAILRKQVKDLPYAFTLDDSLAMSPAARLSGAGQVVVGVRVSRSGQAAPQPGDWEALSAPTVPGSRGLVLVVRALKP
jgi:cytochrome c-type biogenesis protein CcmH